jgi:hypothetical protein
VLIPVRALVHGTASPLDDGRIPNTSRDQAVGSEVVCEPADEILGNRGASPTGILGESSAAALPEWEAANEINDPVWASTGFYEHDMARDLTIPTVDG